MIQTTFDHYGHDAVSNEPGRAEGAVRRLAQRIHGTVLTAAGSGYDAARRGWNLALEQYPMVTVMAACEQDIVAAIEFAADRGLGIAVQATGHGIAVPANGGVLINTSGLRTVQIDPTACTATTSAGASWRDVIPKAHESGLAPLSGSSSGVGVAGYTLGGGSGWLGRLYGFAADSVTSARVVTADARVLDVNAMRHPDLFWALRGGTSNFGIVTRLEFKLYPVRHVYGGGIYWPIERATEVSQLYRDWTAAAPDAVTSRLQLIRVPPLASIPEALRGRRLVSIQGAFAGSEARGVELFKPFRRLGGAVEDALTMMPFTAGDSIARDPSEASAALIHTEIVNDMPGDLVRALADQLQSASRLVSIEIRHQGGALARPPFAPSAVGERPAGFLLNAIAAAMPPDGCGGAARDLTTVRGAIRPWVTGRVLLNGIDHFGADRVRSAYSPETWKRLGKVKRQYDPDNVFRFNRNIPPSSI